MPAIRRYRSQLAEDESKQVKQVLQNLGTGETTLVDVPAPRSAAGMVLIATRRTLISAGTERMLVDFGKASLLDKARKQPDKVRMVLDKIRTDGLFTTVEAIRSKLDQPLALGYCNAGVVIDVGTGVRDFRVGDRVVSNGPHAEIVCVPKNLCARIPNGVSDEAAAFTVLASIGLQGVRLVAPTLGETVVVMGMGLIGLMTAQMLRPSSTMNTNVTVASLSVTPRCCRPGASNTSGSGFIFRCSAAGVSGTIQRGKFAPAGWSRLRQQAITISSPLKKRCASAWGAQRPSAHACKSFI